MTKGWAMVSERGNGDLFVFSSVVESYIFLSNPDPRIRNHELRIRIRKANSLSIPEFKFRKK